MHVHDWRAVISRAQIADRGCAGSRSYGHEVYNGGRLAWQA